MPRKYSQVQEYEKWIFEMRDQGMTWREIGEKLGFSKSQMKQFNIRHNRKQKKLTAGIPPNSKGRPRKGETREPSIAEYKYEIERLKMQNELLRDFLQFTERE